MSAPVRISDEVRGALSAGRPVVALETAAVTHGLPREPLRSVGGYLADPSVPAAVRDAFGGGTPANLGLGRACAAAVRAEGALPAVVGVIRGSLVIGMSDDELIELAQAREVSKVSARDAALVCARGGSGGTTVAGTLLACRIAGIRVFATGGIGGVHRGFAERPDISADLMAIKESTTLVVSAGAKSILDLPATVELLDTLGVPLVGLRTPYFPRFLTEGTAQLRVNAEARDERDAAVLFEAHARMQAAAHEARGMLLCVPPPEPFALSESVMERAIATGLETCARTGIHGPEVTPVLLSEVARATSGASLEVNLGVLVHNARVGAKVARHLSASA